MPVYYGHGHHHRHHDEEDFDGYDYAHPHVQYRKDMEELKEWGIEPYDEAFEESSQHLNRVPASGVTYSGSYDLPQYAPNAKPIASSYPDNSAGAHNLAYSGYLNDVKYNRRPAAQPVAAMLSVGPSLVSGAKTPVKNPYAVFASNMHHQRLLTPAAKSSSVVSIARQDTDDEYYGPIIARLENIFEQLRFHEETCREMLVCNMYKNPTGYSPHSNLVSNELSRYEAHRPTRGVSIKSLRIYKEKGGDRARMLQIASIRPC